MQQQAVIVPVVTAAVIVPAYSASYAPEYAALANELKLLREEIARQRGTPAPVAADLQSLVAAKCASCHGVEKAEASGGGQVLLEVDGALPPLSLAERRRISEVVEKGLMPPRSPLDEVTKAAFRAAVKHRN